MAWQGRAHGDAPVLPMTLVLRSQRDNVSHDRTVCEVRMPRGARLSMSMTT